MSSKFTFIAIALSASLTVCVGQNTRNRLKGDIRVHDPVMIKDGNKYYVFHTGEGVSIKTSRDKINWKKDSSVFSEHTMPRWFTKDIHEHTGHLWAPDIHYRDGKFHLYYSVSAWMNFNSSIGYATNTTLNRKDQQYKWVDEGPVISFRNGGEGVNVIDPNIFINDDGRIWLAYGSYQAGLRMVELDPQTGKLLHDPPTIITLTSALGEGVFIIKGPLYYYIFASRGKCCAGLKSNYEVVMGRSLTLEGPYLNKEGESWLDNKYSIFLQGDTDEPGRGHNGFFTEGNTTFFVYHAYSRSANGAALLNIKPLYIDKDDWPTLNGGSLFGREDFIGKQR